MSAKEQMTLSGGHREFLEFMIKISKRCQGDEEVGVLALSFTHGTSLSPQVANEGLRTSPFQGKDPSSQWPPAMSSLQLGSLPLPLRHTHPVDSDPDSSLQTAPLHSLRDG